MMEVPTCHRSHPCNACEWDCMDDYKNAYKVINVQHDQNSALVKKDKKAFPVYLTKNTRFLVSVGDLCTVKKSKVTGEWLMTDYSAMWGWY